MSLVDKLREATRTGPGLPCGVSLLMDTLKGEERKALEIIFSTKSIQGTVPNTKLHQILISEGHDIAFSSVRHHRSQLCRCYTGADGVIRKNSKKIEKVS
jgi:hypothetical protein